MNSDGLKMTGLMLQNGELDVRIDLDLPRPPEKEVLVKVRMAGVCETDLQLVQGYMNYEGILGHELVGVPVNGKFAGQRVAADINCCTLEDCPYCPENRHHCPNRSVIGILNRPGAFAEYLSVPEENIYLVPESISDERAVFIEPLAAAFQVLEQTEILSNSQVAVLGDGRLGYLTAQVVDSTGAKVLIVGKHAEKLQRFQDRDIETVLLEELERTHNFDFVIDCTGSITGLPLALQLVRPQGTIVMKTTVAEPYQIDLSQIIINEIKLIGSRCGPFPRAIAALENNEIEVESLITSRFPLAEAVAALKTASLKDQHKVLIMIDPHS
ncbi:alcohol dehydrogenase catalytic domain-containing protein [Rubinisphaera sp.]|uniref:MDR/zinc-dependent alcohol dehydrogenase-like family protein n=1 Tax=Rubinisphaera sp. TaxID=2024857 RepID=UPI000C122037|nr:alcohol dehydrogenase catalytic domain-containing protein [Rubinisphaera sp.]MBV08710.1 alcohol dehydrogenase [Rubinisphaera sp.]HCS53183.1 alcohol dehydrogenase [Planctomycetaceae bacterium]|tara:strand:+ start:6560 stop:7540 length:981 start_codon:yes stop_codon:yes gene_type:complete